VSTLPASLGEKLVLRILNTKTTILSLDALGLEEDELETMSGLLQNKEGILLVTGPTGSGKTTTLYASLRQVQGDKVNIVTVEDPVEYRLGSNIVQVQVNEKAGLTFSSALRSILRQDPDVVLIGEIRDLDTLDTALKAADTGHLVFSTLHTTDSTQTINRVLSFYPPHQQNEVRYALSGALAAVISLRLVPRADKHGRVPACEVLINTAAVRDQIRDMTMSLNIPGLIKEGTVQYGMQSFDQSLMAWYTQGAITYENAVFYATNPSEFALRVQGVAGSSDTSWDSFQHDSSP
jgi:twitching motility protein PilT